MAKSIKRKKAHPATNTRIDPKAIRPPETFHEVRIDPDALRIEGTTQNVRIDPKAIRLPETFHEVRIDPGVLRIGGTTHNVRVMRRERSRG